jgi:glycosyltransferase involved in cell wall biosynthesis
MKICLVSTFPPSGRQLNEYALHVGNELRQNPLISLTVVSDKLEAVDFATDVRGNKIRADQLPELPEFDVVRVWKPGDILNPVKIVKAIREHQPDIVWFNLVFSSFATQHDPVAAFVGLCAPALTRLSGVYTHVTLHHIMEHVDFNGTGIKHERLYRFASAIATRMLLMANSVSVLLPGYRKTLIGKYRSRDVYFHSHGILGSRPEYPDFSKRGNPDLRLLAIGHWGTYKRLETLMEAFPAVLREVPNAKIIVAGANHHTQPGYWESIRDKYGRNTDRIEFRGYVPEEEIPDLYKSCTAVVLPYNSATGASGPAHQACQYGNSIISSDISDFVEMAEDEGMAIDFYKRGDADDLAGKMIALLRSPERQRETAERNFSAALRMTMPAVIQQYLRAFERKQAIKSLAALRRFRRLPQWTPSRSALFRSMAAGRWTF